MSTCKTRLKRKEMRLMNKTVLETVGLTKYFGNQVAVDDMSLSVKEGDIYGLLGPNGAGKTTTMKMILNMIEPSSGEILINGEDAQEAHGVLNRQVGTVIESPCFYKNLTGRVNLELVCTLYGLGKKRVDEVLELTEMQNAAEKKVKAYSQGMKQRLAIARAFLADPKVIILDEPTNGLDPSGIRSIRELIKRLAVESGKTIIISTHILSEVEQVCSRVGILNRGRLIQEYEIEDIRNLMCQEEITFEDFFIELTEEDKEYA